MARRSPGATSRSTSRTASRPPKRRPTPRRRRVGSALSDVGTASVAASVTYLMTPPTTGCSCPAQDSVAFLHGGCVRPGGGELCVNRPLNDWFTFGMYWTVETVVFPDFAPIWYDHSASTAWRLESSFTVPNAVFSVTFASAACSGSWLEAMLPLTAVRPFTRPHAAL